MSTDNLHNDPKKIASKISFSGSLKPNISKKINDNKYDHSFDKKWGEIKSISDPEAKIGASLALVKFVINTGKEKFSEEVRKECLEITENTRKYYEEKYQGSLIPFYAIAITNSLDQLIQDSNPRSRL